METTKMLGKPTLDPKFVLGLDKLPTDDAEERARQLFDLFEEHYQDDPTGPAAPALKDLYIEVADQLGLEDGEANERELLAYTTLGTPLESELGVDAFFVLRDPATGAETRVTIDAAPPAVRQLREQRPTENHVLVNKLPDAVQEEGRYLEKIKMIGEEIATKLRTQLEGAEFGEVWKE